MRLLLSALAGLIMLPMAAAPADAQSTARIFSVEIGSSVKLLPVDQWVDPSCGTNGGPPSVRLQSFEDFARCAAEPDTGLHEVWFIYDDEWEYIARAYRDEGEIGHYSANVFYSQPIITSLLIDDAGLVQGYRVVTDPRAPTDVRLLAHAVEPVFKTLFADAPWNCEDLPPEGREEPVDGTFVKEDCTSVTADRFLKTQSRLRRKPGQGDFVTAPEEGQFESSARLEVYNREAVKDEPCCQASLRP